MQRQRFIATVKNVTEGGKIKKLKSLIRFHACMHAKSLQSCPTVRLHRQQLTRVLHPQDSPGKSTGVGCHFLLHLDFKGPVKLTTKKEGEGKGTTTKKIQKNLQNKKSKHKNNECFLFSNCCQSSFPVWESQSTSSPQDTLPLCQFGPAVETAQILIWSYSCMSLPLMSTAIRTSGFSFVGALNDLLYIKQTESGQLIM